MYVSDTLNRKGILSAQGNWIPAASPLPAVARPLGRLEGHRWTHVAVTSIGGTVVFSCTQSILGKVPASSDATGGMPNSMFSPPSNHKLIGGGTSPNHIRFGELASENTMNYAADATFANVRVGSTPTSDTGPYKTYFTGTSSPAVLGRYFKEAQATFTGPQLPAGILPLRATWTEVPCDLWFDNVNNDTGSAPADGWMDASVNPATHPENDQFGAGGSLGPNGLRDVRIDLEVWDDVGTATTADDVMLAHFSDPAADNPIPKPEGRLYYKAVFVNEWDDATRANSPLDVTPYLDDATITYLGAGGPRILAWSASADD